MSFNQVSAEALDALTGDFFSHIISRSNLASLSSGDEVFYKTQLLSALGKNASADVEAAEFYFTESYRNDGEHLYVAKTSAKVAAA